MMENEQGARELPDPAGRFWERERTEETLESVLEALVPSRYVWEYIRRTGWVITDEQKTTLLVHSNLPLGRICALLQKLSEDTPDERLREKIGRYLANREEEYRAFQKNDDGQYIYTLLVYEEDEDVYEDEDPVEMGYFFDYALAVSYGKKSKHYFIVQKRLVATVPDQTYKIFCHRSPPDSFEPPWDGQIEKSEWEYDGRAAGGIHFTGDGEVVFMWFDDEPPNRQAYLQSIWAPDSLENFVSVPPNPFERGDIVVFTRWREFKDYGIVRTSQTEWKKSLAERERHPLDFWNDGLWVDTLNEDGDFGFDCINPLKLELYRPACDDWAAASPRDKLLKTASLLLRGESSLSELWRARYYYREAEDPDAPEKPPETAE